VVVVTYDAAPGVTGYADYSFETDGNHNIPVNKN
jgi:hypothetical protein